MTHIEVLKEMMKEIKAEFGFQDIQHPKLKHRRIVALAAAIECMEKRVPKPMVTVRDPEDAEEPARVCPACRNEIIWFAGYCHNCGQRIVLTEEFEP